MLFRQGTPAQNPLNRSSRLRDKPEAPAPQPGSWWSVTVDFAADGQRDSMTCRVHAETQDQAEDLALARVTAEDGGDFDDLAFTTRRAR